MFRANSENSLWSIRPELSTSYKLKATANSKGGIAQTHVDRLALVYVHSQCCRQLA
jgi:hypothetical protein